MSHEYLLMPVIGVIIAGMVTTVGIGMFSGGIAEANREALIAHLNRLALRAQQYYRKPAFLGGGGGDFSGFVLDKIEALCVDGCFYLSTDVPLLLESSVPAGPLSVSSPAQSLHIVGYGIERGRDSAFFVSAFTTVTPKAIATTVVN